MLLTGAIGLRVGSLVFQLEISVGIEALLPHLWQIPCLCWVCFCTCLCFWARAFKVLFLFHRLWFACFPSYYLMAGFLSPPQGQIEFSDHRLFTLSLKPCNLSWSWILKWRAEWKAEVVSLTQPWRSQAPSAFWQLWHMKWAPSEPFCLNNC